MKTALGILKKHFKRVEKFERHGKGTLSGYDLEGLVGFDHLDTWIVLVREDYQSGKFTIKNAFLRYAYDNWDYVEHDDSDMRNEAVRKRILEIADEISQLEYCLQT